MNAFHIHKYHSINIIPTLSIYSVCEDNFPYVIIAKAFELVLFGYVITLDINSKTSYKYFTTGDIGIRWSRRRKIWYNV